MSLEVAEAQLAEIAIRIDGRNSRNGMCTWAEVRDGIERALTEIGSADTAEVPSRRLARERDDLADLEEMAVALARRAHDIRGRAVA